MKTLDEVIQYFESMYSGDPDEDPGQAALSYLRQYRDSRRLLQDELIGYFGRTPVIGADGFYFAVKTYVPTKKAWRCSRVEESRITSDWVCTDDDSYLINNEGKILCREVGWDMREEPYDRRMVGL